MIKVYHQCTGRWDEILEFIKSQVASMPGDYLKEQKTVEYHNNIKKRAVIKRVQRVVSQNLNKVRQNSGPSTSNRMSQPSTSQSITEMIAQCMLCYVRKATPEERCLRKFAHAADIQSSSSCEEEPPVDPSGDVEDKPAAAEARGSDFPHRTKGKESLREVCKGSKSTAHTNTQFFVKKI